jgi:hypothetical protein
MEGRQLIQCQNVFEGDAEDLKIVDTLLVLDQLRQRQSEFQFAQLSFDLHLPSTRDAEQQRVFGILTERQST